VNTTMPVSDTTQFGTRKMVEWLDDSAMVETWELAENFRGFIVEPKCLNPEHIPNDWIVSSINENSVYIRHE
jgi:hypothetical protein